MSEPEPMAAREVRRNPWIMALALSPLAVVPLLVGLALTGTPAALAGLPHALVMGGFFGWLAWKMNPRPRRVPVELAVERDALVIADQRGERRIARDRVVRGASVPARDGATVQIDAKRAFGAILELSATDAAELLARLGLDARQTTASFSGMSRVHAKGWYVFLTVAATVPIMLLAGALSRLWPGLGALAPLAIIALMVTVFARTKIDVGGDGVLMRWLTRETFFGHGDIARVEVTEHGFGRSRRKVVVLHLASGEQVNLPTGNPRFDGQTAELLAARILEAQAARREGALAPAALLSRGEQSHAAWVAALRKPDAADLRSQAVSKDDLWRLVEDVTAEPALRGAAAVALGKALPPAERARLTQTAKAVAAPKLRVVLEEADHADDEALAEMLEKLERQRA